MEKLKSMTAYVLEQEETSTFDREQLDWYDKEVDKLNKIRNYAKFLSMPLELKYFVPCDDEGKVIFYPVHLSNMNELQMDKYRARIAKYEESIKKDILFEGFKMCNRLESVKCIANGDLHISYEQYKMIEDLVTYNLALTPQAKEKFKL